ncbi:MAG: heavy-metal-associated domain-containing protein, partial [bacterium]
GFIQKYLSSKKTKELIKQESRDMKKVYKVRGMSCKHCVNSVETNLKNIRGIKEVKADLASCEVAIEGETIDQDEIKKTVEGLGYTFEGEK